MVEKKSQGKNFIGGITTAEYARAQLVQPQTVRKRVSQTGTYFGVKPIKLANGKLLWPSDSDERLRTSTGA